MNERNTVQLIGFVGQDLKQKQTKWGYRVAIRMATHFYLVKAPAEKLVKTTWHNVVAWDQQADYAAQNFVKGSKIMVEGRIVYGCFVDKGGVKHFTTHIRAHCLINLDR